MMSKKDYELSARIIRDMNGTEDDREMVANIFMVLFKIDGNPRFQPDTFLRACGLKD